MNRMSAAEYQRTVCRPAREASPDDDTSLKEVLSGKSRSSYKNVDTEEFPTLSIKTLKEGAKNIKEMLGNGKMPPPLEKEIQSSIMDVLALIPDGFFWRENSGAVVTAGRFFRAGIPGIADIMGVYRGVPVAIEVKRPGQKQRLEQLAFMNRYRICGGIYIVCTDSADIIDMLTNEWQGKMRELKVPYHR